MCEVKYDTAVRLFGCYVFRDALKDFENLIFDDERLHKAVEAAEFYAKDTISFKEMQFYGFSAGDYYKRLSKSRDKWSDRAKRDPDARVDALMHSAACFLAGAATFISGGGIPKELGGCPAAMYIIPSIVTYSAFAKAYLRVIDMSVKLYDFGNKDALNGQGVVLKMIAQADAIEYAFIPEFERLCRLEGEYGKVV